MVHPTGFEPVTPCSEDKCSNPLSYGCVFWYARRESNLRHPVPETGALSTELRAQKFCEPNLAGSAPLIIARKVILGYGGQKPKRRDC